MKTKTRKSSYDPGTKGEIIREGNGRYLVESFRHPGEHYSVDLHAETCTCPDWLNRKCKTGEKCKHQEAVSTDLFLRAMDKARSLPIEVLAKQVDRADLRPEILSAVKTVFWCRRYELCQPREEDLIEA